MNIGPTCPRCNTVHPSNAAVAVGRFGTTPRGYVANLTDRPTVLRQTRAEAEADYCAAVAR